MKTEIIKINQQNPEKNKIHSAAQVIQAGGLVAFPTETVYGIACKAENKPIEKLNNIKNRPAGKYYTLHISDKCKISNYVPKITLRAEKLIENILPGPLTIIFEVPDEDIRKLRTKHSNEIIQNLYKDNSIGIRCPDNNIASQLLNSVKYPTVAPSANVSGQPPAANSEQVIANLDNQVDMIIDAGKCKFAKSSTIVKIGSNGISFIREGAVSKSKINQTLQLTFLFVCTGNSCRSPMAEGIFKKELAEKIGLNLDELSEKGYKVISTGTCGMTGVPPSREAVVACLKKGVDISEHLSCGLKREHIEESSLIFVMSERHRDAVLNICPKAGNKTFLLAGNRQIADPIGQTQQYYDKCCNMIEENIKRILSEIQL